MKVLYITHATDLAGANRSMLQMIKELRDNHGVQPFVIFPKIDKDLKHNIRNECKRLNIPFLEHRLTNFKRHKGFSFFHILYFLLVQPVIVLHLFFYIRRLNFDMIHSNSSVNDTGAHLSWLLGIPHVWHLREFGEEDFGLVSCLGRSYEQWVYKKCTFAIAISNAIQEKFSNIFEEEKIRRIYNGIVKRDKDLCSLHNTYEANICIVGRVENNKNQMEALKSIDALIKSGITNFHLTIVGAENKSYKEQLLDYINANKIAEHITFMGTINNVPELLRNMDIGLMLSSNEAFGRVTIEYMLQNLAVVATNAGANPELIINGETGYMYSLGDYEELGRVLKKMISDREHMRKLASNGKKYAEKNFLSTVNSNNVYSLYKEILNT